MIARNFIFTTACLILGTTSIFAQDDNPCASGDLHEELIDSDPIFHRSMMYLNRRIREMQDEINQRDDEIYVIPTVVHVIHEGEEIGEGSNISDAQIFSAITAINEDFRKMTGTNGDGDGVDLGIEFCLASRDPEGNSTTGICRVDGSGLTDYAEMGIEASGSAGADEGEVKALSTWPREDYMNIWVVNEIEDNDAGSGIQGYAYFPMNSPLDGITMLHNAIGTEGNVKPNTDMNRTLTHEIGHFLGCYHTFHNTNNCSEEANCETGGDRVCDTPVTPLAVSCSTPACNGNQQIENYMDYTSETCRNMFTQGQKERMRATLLSERETLLDSFGCVPVTQYDAGISAVQHPTGSICDPSFSPAIMLTNYGSENLTSVAIEFGVDGTLSNAFSWTGDLAPGTSEEVELTTLSASPGDHSIDVEVSNPNGNADENTGNDDRSRDFTVASGSSITLEINVDYFGQETTWMVETEAGETVATGGPYASNAQGTIYEEVICLDEGCYVLHMYDEYNDGMSFLNGTYTLFNQELETLAMGSGNFGSEATHDFCVEIEEGNAPSATFSLSHSEICEGGEIDFSDMSSEVPTEWSWDIQGGNPSSSSSQNPQNIEFNSAGTYQVTLTATNAFGSDSHTETIEIFDLPSVGLSNTEPSCYGDADGIIEAIVNGSGGYTFDWNTGTFDSYIDNIDAGYYVVTVQDMNGCEASASTTLSNPEPIALSIFKTDIACFGSEDGTATASASGGTGSISYEWDNGQMTALAENLGQGSHQVTARDEQACEATETIQIIEPSALVGSSEIVQGETCSGADGHVVINAMGGTGDYEFVWPSGQSGQSSETLSAGDYDVVVIDDNGCETTVSATVPYNCEIDTPTATLTSSDCSATGLYLDDYISCEIIPNAEMYQWKFENAAAGIWTEEQTVGGNNYFLLADIPNLQYGTWVNVTIKVLSNGAWSPYGETCQIWLADAVPGTELVSTDCDSEGVQVGAMIQTNPVTGATEYEWMFTGLNYQALYISYMNTLTLHDLMGLQAGATYHIAVRAKVGDLWGDFGSSCNIQMDVANGISDIGNSPEFLIYPNPGNGEQICIDFGNLTKPSSVSNFELFNTTGHLVETFRLSDEATALTKTKHNFEHKLSAGLYVLRYSLNGVTLEEKLIVR